MTKPKNPPAVTAYNTAPLPVITFQQQPVRVPITLDSEQALRVCAQVLEQLGNSMLAARGEDESR